MSSHSFGYVNQSLSDVNHVFLLHNGGVRCLFIENTFALNALGCLASSTHHLFVHIEQLWRELVEAFSTSASHTEEAAVLGGLLHFIEAFTLNEMNEGLLIWAGSEEAHRPVKVGV